MANNQPLCRATNEGEQAFDQLHNSIASSHTEKDVKRYIEGTALEYVGQGDSRVVLLDTEGTYLHSNNACVVKINKHGDNGSVKKEVDNWQKAPQEISHRLLRVTDWDSDYRWNIMPYIDTSVTDEMLIELEKDFIRSGWKIGDVKKRNAARVQDRAVMIDYDGKLNRIDFSVMSEQERLSLIDWKYD